MQELKAREHCCEEASTLSHNFYIPCNRPAVAIVGWKGRSDTPIRMCDQCEWHNVHNRGGYRVEAYKDALPEVSFEAGIPVPRKPAREDRLKLPDGTIARRRRP